VGAKVKGKRIKKARDFFWSLFLLALSVPANAQELRKVPRIGVLRNDTPVTFATRNDAFRQGLRELGYVEGKNIVIEYRYAAGNTNRLPDLATELVNLKVDVIVVGGGTTEVAKKATTTIPIVVGSAGDLVGGGHRHSEWGPFASSKGTFGTGDQESASVAVRNVTLDGRRLLDELRAGSAAPVASRRDLRRQNS
jgi:ABC-type uncharacterized transport system substrate-binding protein